MEQVLYTYLEIIQYNSGNVIKRMDLSGKTDNEIDKIDSGLNINLNHNEYYTLVFGSESKKEIIK